MLTAKHHEGFNLFPSAFTNHSVASSSWRSGLGDVAREFTEASHKYGIKTSFYNSPWDENSPDYCEGRGGDYNEFYLNTLTELFGNYGEMSEVWLDNANGWLANCSQPYDTDTYFSQSTERQPNLIIWSSWGPDGRWIGNENGVNQEEHWSPISISFMKESPDNQSYLGRGDPNGPDWVAAEADVSIRPGWFYHTSEDSQVRSPDNLMDLYIKSVGRNSILFLNIPPTPEGLFHQNDIDAVLRFREIREQTFGKSKIPSEAVAEADSAVQGFTARNVLSEDYESYWAPGDNESHRLEIDFKQRVDFDLVQIQEFIPLGQRVKKFKVYYR